MRRKYKMTGFARFLIFMVIFAPLAYIGASYYQGEDGIENFKNLIGMGDPLDQKSPEPVKELSPQDIIEMKDEEIRALKMRINELESELRVQNSN